MDGTDGDEGAVLGYADGEPVHDFALVDTLGRLRQEGLYARQSGAARGVQEKAMPAQSRTVTVQCEPEPLSLEIDRTAVLVIDMQNDFGAKDGMFDRKGIDISAIHQAVGPTARVLERVREERIPVIYLKMEHRPDLSDAGAADEPHRRKHGSPRAGGRRASARRPIGEGAYPRYLEHGDPAGA